MALWLRDVVAFGIQTAAVIAVGAALAFALRLREPKTALVYWRVLLLVCLLLPFCQSWKATSAPAIQPIPPPASSASGVSAPGGASNARIDLPRLETVAAVILAGGAVARGLWILACAWALRRLRQGAAPLAPAPSFFLDAQQRLGVAAEFRVSDRVEGPITFGARRPVILVPRSVLGMEPHVQEAIAYHELVHVQRGDWLHELVEQLVRTILWFHPAVHWLIARIQLSREQVVDRVVIGLTESRERYVEALLAVALREPSMSLVPAPLFFRRHLLKQRLAQILEEATMSTRRLIASVSLSAVALALTAVVGMRVFPLRALAQEPERVGAPVRVVSGGDHLLHGQLPEYPRRAVEQRIEGDVVLDLSLDDRGEVSDARVLSGPDELRKAALQSVLGWHYSPDALRSTSTQVTLRFHVPPDGIVTYENRVFAFTREAGSADELTPAQRAERKLEEIQKAMQSATTQDQKAQLERTQVEVEQMLEKIQKEQERNLAEMQTGPDEMIRRKLEMDSVQTEKMIEPQRAMEGTARIVQIRAERASRENVKEFVARAGISIGDVFTEETARRIRAAASGIDEHFRVSFQPDGRGGMVVTLVAPGSEIR